MFKNLRQGNSFYILHKGKDPYCEIGSVANISSPKPRYPNNYMYQQPQGDMVVDVKVKVGDDNINLPNVSADLPIMDYPTTTGETLVISCNLDAINSEINSMLQQSKQIVESVEYHQSIIQGCDKMMKQLNPQFAKEQEQEEKIKSLENELTEIRKMFGGGMEEIKQLLRDKQQVSTNKK